MKDAKIKWRTKGAKTTIVCFQVGENYFTVREMDNTTGEITTISQTFSLVEAWDSYYGTVDARVRKALGEQDKARRPEGCKKALVVQPGQKYATDLRHPFMRELLEDYHMGKRIPPGDALTEGQRREFDRMVVEFLAPDLPREILDFTRKHGA